MLPDLPGDEEEERGPAEGEEKDLPEEEKPEEADRDGAMGVLPKEEGRDGLRYEPP